MIYRAVDLFPEGHPILTKLDPALTIGGLLSHRRNYQDVWAAITESPKISRRLVEYVMDSNEYHEMAGKIPQRMATGLGLV